MAIIKSEWRGLYRESWGKTIVPEAYCHPAKFRPALIRQIYMHLLEQGYISTGQMVLDPFAGVALGALHAMQNGLVWLGVELESRFVELGQQNIDLWNRRYSTLKDWGNAVILQGDSRRLCEVLAGAAGVVSSPPYSGSEMGGHGGEGPNCKWRNGAMKTPDEIARRQLGAGYGSAPGQLASLPEGDAPQVPQVGAVVSSMPYAGSAVTSDGQRGIDVGNAEAVAERRKAQRRASPDGYSTALGQLGNLPTGDPPQAIVSSPPFGEAQTGGGIASALAGNGDYPLQGTITRSGKQTRPQMGYRQEVELGNLAGLPTGEPPAAVPWQNQNACNDPDYAADRPTPGGPLHGDYGQTDGQLGTESGTTFWAASAEIMRQVYQVLAPGAVAVWVCKAFVRHGERVDFPGQWAALGEACGFETLEIIRAWLVENYDSQHTLDGGLEQKQIARKSFFRLLAEKKGSPRIDYEVVLIQRKGRNE